MWARELMTTPVVSVSPSTPIKQAAATLTRHGLTACPVLDHNGLLVGMVSGIDLLRQEVPQDPRAHMIRQEPTEPPPAVVAEVMTRHVISVHPHADVADAVALMAEHDLRSLPVVDERRVVGVLSRTDVLRALARSDDEIATQVRRQLRTCLGRPAARVWVHVDRGVVTMRSDGIGLDLEVLRRIAETVPGVVRVHAMGMTSEHGCVP